MHRRSFGPSLGPSPPPPPAPATTSSTYKMKPAEMLAKLARACARSDEQARSEQARARRSTRRHPWYTRIQMLSLRKPKRKALFSPPGKQEKKKRKRPPNIFVSVEGLLRLIIFPIVYSTYSLYSILGAIISSSISQQRERESEGPKDVVGAQYGIVQG